MRFACAALLVAGCVDPVHDERVAALGDEPAGQEPGPLHRPGQPCLVCHGGEGPAESVFTAAGTVYLRADEDAPAPGVEVVLTDAGGAETVKRTNAAGSFYTADELTFPLTTALRDGTRMLTMRTPIGRDGSCASCHAGDGDAWRMPRVYLEAP